MPPIPDTGWVPPTTFPNLAGARALSFDVETKDPELKKRGPGWARGKGHLCGLAVGTDDGGRWYFPMRHEVEKDQNLDPDHVLAWARDTLGNPRQPKIGANITYDIGWLKEEGVEVRGPLYDVQFAEALLDERARVNLEELGQRYLGQGKQSNLLYEWCAAYYGGRSTANDQGGNIHRAPPRLVGPYAESDVDIPFRVLDKQWPLLVQQNLHALFTMECELIPLMIAMRFAGVRVDYDRAQHLHDEMLGLRDQSEREVYSGPSVKQIDAEIRGIVGFEVNTDASASIARAFDTLGLRYGRTEKGAPSFRAGFLETVQHPLAELILRRKRLKKLIGTFLKGYILDSHVNGRLFGQFHQLRASGKGARSGRYSSSTPNLQNIPSRSVLGKIIRTIFIPDIGHKQWRKKDYSQIEYRGLAHYAVGPGADDVRARYLADPRTDFHKMVHGIILAQTGQDLDRAYVKNTNFGTVYGMGVAKLAVQLGIPFVLAKQVYETIHGAAPFMKATMDETMIEAQRTGYITTILGRRSRFDLWVPFDWEERQNAWPLPYEQAITRYRDPVRAYLHKALNRRLQGSAADLIKAAMLQCWKDGVFDYVGVPRLTVHDELDFSDAGLQYSEEAFAHINRVMENAIQFRVPIMVEEEVGPNWGEVKKLKAA
jgi:DNA polymerase-1